MSLTARCRTATHLTLAMAALCMLYAEMGILPWMGFLLPPVLGLILVAALVEKRWYLSLEAANVLALLVAVGFLGWLVLQLLRPGWLVASVPLPTGLIPFAGPILLALVLLKLFRPRTEGDFWTLQGVGLLQVGVGCILASGLLFGFLLLGYLASGLTCLYYHHLARRGGSPLLPSEVGWRRGLRWALAVGLGALALFLVTPRISSLTWDPDRRYSMLRQSEDLRTGLDSAIDLNTTGEVEVDDSMALTVRVTRPDGQPREDLSLDSYWRGLVLSHYQDGHWLAVEVRSPYRRRPPQRRLPDLGPEQYFCHFALRPQRSGGLVLAEPILFGSGENRDPVIVEDDPPYPLFREHAGTMSARDFSPFFLYRYRQVSAPLPRPERRPGEVPREWTLRELLFQPVAPLPSWTGALLERLSKEEVWEVTPEDLGPAEVMQGGLSPYKWRRGHDAEQVALALTSWLARSGELTYSLNLKRKDRKLDPTLDFLWNTRQGHCERFASALALMLRSQSIPARVVKGFRGAEQSSPGTYLIRHSHAHTWVEALVPARPGLDPAGVEWVWLRLDPTPATEAAESSGSALWRWWKQYQRDHETYWQLMIVGYDSDSQAQLWTQVKGALPAALPAAGLLAAIPLLRRLRWPRGWGRGGRLPAPPAPAHLLFAHLLGLLRKHCGLALAGGQTPRELAGQAQQHLLSREAEASLPDVPRLVTEAFYRARYGEEALSGEEQGRLEQGLARLEAWLVQPAGTPAPVKGGLAP